MSYFNMSVDFFKKRICL